MQNVSVAFRRVLLAAATCGFAITGLAETPTPAVDPAATAALEKMGAYLRTLNAFEVKSVTSTDEVLESGQKIQFDAVNNLKVQRPNHLQADMLSDRKHVQLFYDGKTATIYRDRMRYYATVPAPATIHELTEALAQKHGIEIPLADLFYWGTKEARLDDIKSADYLGPATVDGAPCDQYAFRQEGVDWQVWIQKGNTPLPRKLVITTTSDPSQPQYAAVIHWNVNPKFTDRTFVFSPPAGARRIAMQTTDGPVAKIGK